MASDEARNELYMGMSEMEELAHTATVLDRIAEYVKELQRRPVRAVVFLALADDGERPEVIAATSGDTGVISTLIAHLIIKMRGALEGEEEVQ